MDRPRMALCAKPADCGIEWAFDGSGAQTPFMGCEERPFVVRRDGLLRTGILIGFLVNHNTSLPPIFL
jgi:hypothetical protein